MKLWIRIDAAVRSDPNVDELARRLNMPFAEAVGLCVLVWGAIAEHRRDGNLEGISPETIGFWAGLAKRDRAVFGGEFLALFAPGGSVNESGPIGLRPPNRTSGVPWWTRLRIFARDGRVCRACGSTSDLQIDHIEPWILGGSDADSNLQVLCRTCNMKKGPRAGAGNR